MNSKKAEILMVSVSFVWGSSYLLMKIGLGSIAPFNLIALRFGIAFLFMTLVFSKKYRSAKPSDIGKGILMGILLFLTFSGMVYGVSRTTASTAGFLASTTVIFIPILESIIWRKLPRRMIPSSPISRPTGSRNPAKCSSREVSPTVTFASIQIMSPAGAAAISARQST